MLRNQSLDQPRIGVEDVAGAELLDARRLRANVSGDETGGTEFVEFGSVNSDGISVNRRTFEMTGESRDHA